MYEVVAEIQRISLFACQREPKSDFITNEHFRFLDRSIRMRYIQPIGGTPAQVGKRTRSSKSDSSTSHTKRATIADSDNCSPSKRMKETTHLTTVDRNFGEELCTNKQSATIFDSISNINGSTEDVASDCGTQVSSVAHLRAHFHEFGEKNHHHFTKSAATATLKDEGQLVVERRPKVRPSLRMMNGPTPLPPAAAHALVKRMSMGPPLQNDVMTADPVTVPATTNMNCEPSTQSLSASLPAVFRARATPVRIRIPVAPSTDVQATNEGYASVAQLSRWLADDPTSTKKTRQLRRGANIIAKSRKFDKVLANVVVEECIPRDTVSRQKNRLAKAWSEDDNGSDDLSVQSMAHQTVPKKDWQTLGSLQSNSEGSAPQSVSDKKKWLMNAFPTTNQAVAYSNNSKYVASNSARSEIVTSKQAADEIGSRAKEKWRKNRTPTKSNDP